MSNIIERYGNPNPWKTKFGIRFGFSFLSFPLTLPSPPRDDHPIPPLPNRFFLRTFFIPLSSLPVKREGRRGQGEVGWDGNYDGGKGRK
jgi:hypothetical protein